MWWRKKQSNEQSVLRRRILTVERLEDRIAPVIGNGANPPVPIAAGGMLPGGVAGELDHVVRTQTSGTGGFAALEDLAAERSYRHNGIYSRWRIPSMAPRLRFNSI